MPILHDGPSLPDMLRSPAATQTFTVLCARYALPVTLVCLVHAAVLVALWPAAPVAGVTAPRVLDVVLLAATPAALLPIASAPNLEPVHRPEPKPNPMLNAPAPKPAPPPMAESAATPSPPLPVAAAPVAAPEPAPVVVPPRFDASYRGNPKPRYPPASERLGEKGTVLLRIYVKADGSVGEMELKKSSGYPRLDQSAMSTVKQWKLIPARRGDEPIAMWYVLPITFRE